MTRAGSAISARMLWLFEAPVGRPVYVGLPFSESDTSDTQAGGYSLSSHSGTNSEIVQ
jgi:hypothetical protein